MWFRRLSTALCCSSFDVWFRVLSRCLFNSYWKIDINQLQVQSMIWALRLQIRKHGYFSGLDFIILFVGILPLYAINLAFCHFAVVSDCGVLYQFDWMNIVLFLSKKKTNLIHYTFQEINTSSYHSNFYFYKLY